MQLSGFGVWASSRTLGGEQSLAEAAKVAEELGFTAFWLGGSPHLSSLRLLLEGSERLVIATGIVNVWQYDPTELAAEHAELVHDFPGRLLIGIGIGHPEATSAYEKPLTTMSRFLDALDSASTPLPAGERCLAALGPKMLELSASRSRGALPYFTPLEHTRFARERLGPDALLATELACVLDTDVSRARATARDYSKLYLGLTNYTSNLLRFGFTEQDIANGGSDRLIDEVVPHGTAAEVAEVANAHVQAGANHVCLQPVGGDGVPGEQWAALAEQLIR